MRSLLGIEMAVGPVQDVPHLLKFGMLILHRRCWTAVPHGAHDNGKIAGALQHPGSIIVTPAIKDKLFGKPGLTSSLAKFPVHGCQMPRREPSIVPERDH